jgi:hypothetical protein
MDCGEAAIQFLVITALYLPSRYTNHIRVHRNHSISRSSSYQVIDRNVNCDY